MERLRWSLRKILKNEGRPLALKEAVEIARGLTPGTYPDDIYDPVMTIFAREHWLSPDIALTPNLRLTLTPEELPETTPETPLV